MINTNNNNNNINDIKDPIKQKLKFRITEVTSKK